METTMIGKSRFRLSPHQRRIIFDIICYVFVILFIYTASSKIMTFHRFSLVLAQLPTVGKYGTALAYLIPGVEILVSLLLIIPSTKRIGMWGALITMLVFTIYLTYIVLQKGNLPCSCGGVISKMSWKQHVLFNIFFVILSAFGIRLSSEGGKEH